MDVPSSSLMYDATSSGPACSRAHMARWTAIRCAVALRPRPARTSFNSSSDRTGTDLRRAIFTWRKYVPFDKDNHFCCKESCGFQNYLYLCIPNTVRLVQLAEHQIVVLGVVGSSPTSHPKTLKAWQTPSFRRFWVSYYDRRGVPLQTSLGRRCLRALRDAGPLLLTGGLIPQAPWVAVLRGACDTQMTET